MSRLNWIHKSPIALLFNKAPNANPNQVLIQITCKLWNLDVVLASYMEFVVPILYFCICGPTEAARNLLLFLLLLFCELIKILRYILSSNKQYIDLYKLTWYRTLSLNWWAWVMHMSFRPCLRANVLHKGKKTYTQFTPHWMGSGTDRLGIDVAFGIICTQWLPQGLNSQPF